MTMSGGCFCRAVRWQSMGEILWAALCHCEDCRRAASSDYVSWFGVPRASLEWSGEILTYASSRGVVRTFCKLCGSPLSFETAVFVEETHLYAATLDIPSLYRPTAHIFWSERLPWVTDVAGLPTHEKGLQDAATNGMRLLD